MSDVRSALVVSPHADDSALTFGNIMRLMADSGVSVSVVTLFENTDASLRRRRQQEDARYCDHLGTNLHCGGFIDADDRLPGKSGESSIERVFEAELDVKLVGRVARLIGSLARGFDVILSPVGVGGHIDHLTAAAAVRLAGCPNVLWGFDFPYTVRHWRRDTSRIVWPRPATLVASRFLDKNDPMAKLEAILKYDSQMRSLWDSREHLMDDFARYHSFDGRAMQGEFYLSEGAGPDFCDPVAIESARGDWAYIMKDIGF